jgi:thiol:disulfide interchange protein
MPLSFWLTGMLSVLLCIIGNEEKRMSHKQADALAFTAIQIAIMAALVLNLAVLLTGGL